MRSLRRFQPIAQVVEVLAQLEPLDLEAAQRHADRGGRSLELRKIVQQRFGVGDYGYGSMAIFWLRSK